MNNEKYAVSASEDTTVKIWDANDGKEIHTLLGHTDPVEYCCCTADSLWVVSCSRGKTSRIWEIETGNIIAVINDVECMGISMNYFVAFSASDHSITVYDIIRNRQQTTRREGNLMKQGVIMKLWKPRYFVLQSGQLVYFLSAEEFKKGLKFKGSISLAEATVKACSIKKFSSAFPFAVETPIRTNYMVAKTETERSEWIHSIYLEIVATKSNPEPESLHITY